MNIQEQNCYRLSFCIPTLNRADFLLPLLEDLVERTKHYDVEIVVVDGGSSDNTVRAVEDFRDRHNVESIKLIESTGRSGLDRDLELAVRNARGAYCWLMSDDDLITPGGFEYLWHRLESESDLYLFNIFYCNFNMEQYSQSCFLKAPDGATFDISDDDEFTRYLSLSSSNNTLLCYMSNFVFNRSLWCFRNHGEYVFGYNHVVELLMAREGLESYVIEYVRQPLVNNRGYNDSFSREGLFRRYSIDFEGYKKICERLHFQSPSSREAFIANMRREHGLHRIVKLKLHCTQSEWAKIQPLLEFYGYPNHALFLLKWLPHLPLAEAPFSLLNRTVKKIRAKIRAIS